MPYSAPPREPLPPTHLHRQHAARAGVEPRHRRRQVQRGELSVVPAGSSGGCEGWVNRQGGVSFRMACPAGRALQSRDGHLRGRCALTRGCSGGVACKQEPTRRPPCVRPPFPPPPPPPPPRLPSLHPHSRHGAVDLGAEPAGRRVANELVLRHQGLRRRRRGRQGKGVEQRQRGVLFRHQGLQGGDDEHAGEEKEQRGNELLRHERLEGKRLSSPMRPLLAPRGL